MDLATTRSHQGHSLNHPILLYLIKSVCLFDQHRNSFRSLHRPDLKRVPYLRRMSPDELETLFRGYADLPPKAKAKTGNILNCYKNYVELYLPTFP